MIWMNCYNGVLGPYGVLSKSISNLNCVLYQVVQTNLRRWAIIPNTHPNLKHSDKSLLIDLFLTNVPHKYSMVGSFANDISDHCVIAAVRNAIVPKTKPHFVIKRNMKIFVKQGFRHDLYGFDWVCNDVQTA